MGIRINYGTSKKKNTKVCITEMNAVLERNSGENLILLVPEQFSSYYEQLLVEKSIENGSFRAEILTFKRLAYRIFAKHLENGSKYLDNAGKSMLMYEVVSDRAAGFEAFAKSGKYPAFANEALKTVREFKRYKVTPDILLETVHKTGSKLLSKKMEEMAGIYSAYEEKLRQQGYCDADDNMTNLALTINKYNEFRNTRIWIDGFDGFTPAEMDVIESLMSKSSETVFSFCCNNLELPDISNVFHPVVKTVAKVQKASERLGFRLNEKKIAADPPEATGIPGEIEHLAAGYFQYPGNVYTGSLGRIKLYKANSIHEEIERCALEISNKVRSGKFRYGDICVVSGLYDEYREYIDAVFKKFDIPVFLDEKRSIAKHPVAAYLLALLEIYIKKYSYESVFQYLKSPYADIDFDEMTILENYILQWDIKGTGMWTGKDWGFYTNEPNNEDKLRKLNETRKKITGILEPLFSNLKYGLTADEFIYEIYNFMMSRGIFEKIKVDAKKAESEGRLDYADELKQSWNILMDIFNQIHLISPAGKQTAEKYRIFLELALSQKKIGVIPPRTDAVFAGKIDKAYGNGAKMLMILGTNDPGFPEKIVNEGLLTDKDRADILTAGLELAPDTKTQVMNSLIDTYNLLNIPESHLYVSYSTSGPDGSSRQRSNFYDRMEDLFEEPILEDSSMVDSGEYILNPMMGLEILSCRRDRSGPLERWYRENGLPIVTDVPGEVIPNIKFDAVIRKLIGDAIEVSPTDIEKYVDCPYKYFAGNALKINPRREYQISSPDVGSILHGIIKELVTKFIDDDKSDYDKYIEESSQILKDMKFSQIFNRDKRHGFLGERLVKRAVDSFMILKHQIQKGDFKPIVLEAAFGRNKAISAPMFLTEGHNVYLKGRIDRVDGAIIDDNEYFRIIDYKSSDRKLSLYKINKGLDIQLASYLMTYGMHSGTEPAGMYYFTTDKKLVQAEYGDNADAVYDSIVRESCMEGYTLNKPSVINAMDSEVKTGSGVIPVKYNAKKDEFSNKVLPPETIEAMTNRIGEIVSENTERIFSCKFPVEPVNADKTACTYCDYNDICGFDSRRPECKFRTVVNVRDKDIVWGNNG